ncbi:MAG: isoprenylcysteine carboxylmethyltransferase family protein [Anaerolineae bacterium]|jgi:protein-S-isoprenylcysteine O-methyltransferase Ste14|nr:isoprenylcysteine carboxylmethyltransferase family protein [Anaerolineae bacterium]
MSTNSAHQNRWAIGEVVFGIPLLTGILLQRLAPAPLPFALPQIFLTAAGITLSLAGVGLMLAARRELARYYQPTDPGAPTTALVQTGPYALSRNPLYLAAALLFSGVALILNNLWAVGALLLALFLCHCLLILPEERYLAAKFGADYTAYVATVHRWVGRKL